MEPLPLGYPQPRPQTFPPQMSAAAPDWRTRIVNAMMATAFGESPQGRDWAERSLGLLEGATPLGFLTSGIDAAGSMMAGHPGNAMLYAAGAVPGFRGRQPRPRTPEQIAAARTAAGFGPETWFHGTPQPGFSEFDLRRLGETSRGGMDGRPAAWVTLSPDLAAWYADAHGTQAWRRNQPMPDNAMGVYPVVTNPGANPFRFDVQGYRFSTPEWYANIDNWAEQHRRRTGSLPTSMRIDNVNFGPLGEGAIPHPNQTGLASVMALYQPNQLRSPWARFDPGRASSGNLLAGGVGAALLGGQSLWPDPAGSGE